MRDLLDNFHEFLGNCRSVADYLGYTLRGYMKIRRKVFNGQPLLPRVEALLRFKAEQLASESLNKNHEGVAPVTNPINRGLSNGQLEFNKALKRIKNMFQAGKNRKTIHAKLTEAGRISMSYPRFCVLVAQENDKEPFIPAEAGSKAAVGKKGRPKTSSLAPAGTGKSIKRQPAR